MEDELYVAETDDLILNLRIEDIIINPDQPRKKFDLAGIEELAASIDKNGLIQPIIVRKEANKYRLIAGERRLRAAKLLGHDNILSLVKKVDDERSDRLSIVENIQREDLNPVEEALAYKNMMETYGMTQKELAGELGKSRSYIANSTRLLNLEEEVLNHLAREDISIGHAKALLALEGEDQIKLSKLIIEEKLTVRETEKLIKNKKANPLKKKKDSGKDPYLKSIEDDLMMHLGTKVNLVQSKNKGRIEIEYYSEEDLSRILDMFK